MFRVSGLIQPARVAATVTFLGSRGLRLLCAALLGGLCAVSAWAAAGDAVAGQASEPAVSPQPYGPPRVLLYFPFLPVPGVPPQWLPAPPAPYIWPMPVLVILPAMPPGPPPPAPRSAGPEAPVAAPRDTVDANTRMTQEAATAEVAQAQPVPAEPGLSQSTPPGMEPPVPETAEKKPAPAELAVPAAAGDVATPNAKPAPVAKPVIQATTVTPKARTAVKQPKPVTKPAPVKSKVRKLCWKDGRLDVCK